MELNQLRDAAHAMAREKGWWDGDPGVGTPDPKWEKTNRSMGDVIANIHSEVSEAWEEYRAGAMESYYLDDLGNCAYYEQDAEEIKDYGRRKPEGFGIELIDAIIRIADLAGRMGLDLDELVRIKMAFNATRGHRHGEKRA